MFTESKSFSQKNGSLMEINFDKFKETSIYLDGAAPKKCIVDKNGRYGVLKSNRRGKPEDVSEWLCYMLGLALGVRVADVDLGKYKGEPAFASWWSIPNNAKIESFSDCASYSMIISGFGTGGMQYDFNEILGCIQNRNRANLEEGFFKMIFYDCIIGNHDRHGGNWGFYNNHIAPLYDNGGGLFCDIYNIQQGKDLHRFIYEYPKYAIKFETNEVSHFELLKLIKKYYPMEYTRYKLTICDEKVESIVNLTHGKLSRISRETLIRLIIGRKNMIEEV